MMRYEIDKSKVRKMKKISYGVVLPGGAMCAQALCVKVRQGIKENCILLERSIYEYI
jgi:hypothetical protein